MTVQIRIYELILSHSAKTSIFFLKKGGIKFKRKNDYFKGRVNK